MVIGTGQRAFLFLRGIMLTILFVLAEPATSFSGELRGHICDSRTEEVLPYVTIQAMGTGRSTSSNETGEFRLVLKPGQYEVKVSHIGYFSQSFPVQIADSTSFLNVRLQPTLVEIPGMKVFDKAYNPAQEIIVEAIRRKKDILSKLHDYEYDAYSKFAVNDATNEDSTKILLIAESQTTAYWEQPDKYKEVITARRQTSNIQAEGNLVAVGEILNFNKNRIELGEYSIVSPTATDALDHYNYYMDDTTYIDSMRVFVLDVEPKSETDPLFEGKISIVDSTFDVVTVDVGFNNAVRFPLVETAHYKQRMAQFNNEFWMPIEIRFGGVIVLKMAPPGIPSRLSFDYSASLYSFSFEKGHAPGTFDEYQLVVKPEADDYDSLTWQSHQTIPLTSEEVRGYERIDSLKQRPPSPKRIALMAVAGAMYLTSGGQYDVFHFNRVEGPYLGLGFNLRRAMKNTEIHPSVGYAFDAKKWQYGLAVDRQIWSKKRLRIGGEVHNQVVHRPAITLPPGYNPTFEALFYQGDPLDYYLEKGFSLSAGLRPIAHFNLSATFQDYQQSSLVTNTDYSIFDDDDNEPVRANPPVIDGDLRSVSLDLQYDSRKLIDNKGVDLAEESLPFTTLRAGIEYSSPDFASSDFNFRSYRASLFHSRRMFGMGVSSLYLYWGSSDGQLPPQRYYTVAFGDPVFVSPTSFKTLNKINFVGNRVAVAYASHDFGRRLWEMSGIPGIKKIPLTLGIHGGAFWTEFRGGVVPSVSEMAHTARTAYSEIGFSVGNLTPFLSPFNFALAFTWQLSTYPTDRFAWQMGIRL